MKRRIAGNSDSGYQLSQATNPLASPHRAGHYSGLHPEDQPFQSSFYLHVQRPASVSEPFVESEELKTVPEKGPSEREDLFWLDQEQQQEDRTPVLAPSAQQIDAMAEAPTYPPVRAPWPETPLPLEPRRPVNRMRVVASLIAASLILFLLATSLFVFLLLGRSPARQAQVLLSATPAELRAGDLLQLTGQGFHSYSQITVTRDAQVAVVDGLGGALKGTTDGRGTFQLHIPILASWSLGRHVLRAIDAQALAATTSITIQPPAAGPPSLQLNSTRLALGAGNQGTTSQKSVMLTNTGGSQVNWQAKSNVAWLSLNPASGTFSGHAVVVVSVQRTHLAPQAYLGQITFTQKQGTPQILSVSMSVNALPANLVLSPGVLSFLGTPAQNPTSQQIVVQNNGGQVLNWMVGSTTSNGANWLSVTPNNGILNAGTSAVLTVAVTTTGLSQGAYQGALSFSYAGGEKQVAVDLTVKPVLTPVPSPTPTLPSNPALSLTPRSVSFSANEGSDPDPKSFTVSNTGGGLLNWSIQEDANALTYLEIAPQDGQLAAGQSVTVTIAPMMGNATGTIHSILTVVDSDQGTTVPAQQVNITVVNASEPVITLITSDMQFLQDSISTDSSQILMFSNTGSVPLNWALNDSPDVPWLSFSATSGTLAANGNTMFITVECNSAGLKPQTDVVTVTIKDTDAGTVTAPQQFTITLTVSS